MHIYMVQGVVTFLSFLYIEFSLKQSSAYFILKNDLVAM